MSDKKDSLPTPLWIFGYASLMWNPGFDVAQTELATLKGFDRSFCMSSIHHRGTEEEPGLVLALDAKSNAACRGLALRVADGKEQAAITYLRERELISSAYVEQIVSLDLDVGQTVSAVAYVVDPKHEQYVANMALETQAQIIAKAVGGRGPNTEYLWNTVDRLSGLGIEDTSLTWLATRVRQLVAA